MLLAIRSKSRRESSVRVDYLIHVQEIKPWPLSQSSRGQTPVVLHWERGDRHSGSTRRATPQGGQGIDNGKIVFNESFLLPATLFRESKNKSRSMTEERFQKKCLELNLYESKSERLGKGHLLGSAVVDLAQYGVPKSSISLSLPLKVKRGSRLAAQQPALILSIGPYDKNSVPEGLDSEKSQASVSPSSSSGYNTLSSTTSLDKDSKDSVAAAEFTDEGAEEAEIMSFTDADTDGESSHHSIPLVNVLEAKIDSASTKLEDNPGSREVEEEPEGVEINSEGVQKILVSSLDILAVETSSSSSSSKAVHSSPVVSCASSASHSSYSGSLDNEVRLRTSPQLNFGSPILSQISPSFSLTSSEHKLGKHSNTKNRNTGEVPLGNIQEAFGGKTKTSFDDTVDKEFPGVNEKGKIKPGEDKREITKGSYSLGDIGSDQRKLEIKTFKLNDGKNEYEDSLNEKGKIKPREDKREITEGSYSLGDTGSNQRQLEINTFKLNDGKNEYEANGFYSEVVTAGEELATTQVPVAEFMIEEEAPKRLTGGAQGAEVLVDKIAQLEKVAQKEGSYQSAEPCSRLAKAAMEKPIGVKHASKLFRDPPKKGTKAGTEVRNGGKNGPGSRVKSVQDSKPKNLKGPVKSTSDSDTNPLGELDDKFIEEVKEINISEIPFSNPGNGAMNETDEKPDERISKEENMKIIFAEARAAVADEKMKQMELEIEKLEGELREAAAVEAALYSVVAEHGSSSHKVHSPARRLARLYIHACKHWSQDRRAGAARNAVSGLILVAKACGNDVSRLTFWWSNTIVLRETVSQAFDSCQLTEQLSHSNGRNGMKINQSLLSPRRSRDNITKQGREKLKKLDEWDETQTFVTALQEIESWIHGRIVESVWWQTLTPYMQSPSEVTITQYRRLYSKKSLEKLLGPELGDHQQGKFSIDLWKRAFLDAFQRLCPVRAGGHECGCLPVLAKMVMEQCVARLDVAMFNAILRQSEEEMPTDPISDPITAPSVLPIPAGNLCFGSGAQLKNAVGNWSRFLTDLVGIDAENPFQEGVDIEEDNCEDIQELLNSFPILNATSDLLMLPKDLLMDKSIRNEVCPVLSLPIIKRILCNFVPDEFCPDPVPLQLMETINAEIPLDRRLQCGEDSNSSSLVSAPPVEYSPPPVSLVKDKLGGANDIHLRRSASGVLRKGYTSDDELDELESPISLLVESVPAMSSQKNKVHSNGKSGGNTKQPTIKAGLNRRYQLLREAWADK